MFLKVSFGRLDLESLVFDQVYQPSSFCFIKNVYATKYILQISRSGNHNKNSVIFHIICSKYLICLSQLKVLAIQLGGYLACISIFLGSFRFRHS